MIVYSMDKVFIYWDNSNIYISARAVAEEREGRGAYERVRVHFGHLMKLAHANREVEKAIAVGSVPPEMRHLWHKLENEDVQIELLERGAQSHTEQGVDQMLQNSMLRDALHYNGDPGVAVLLTGDGRGFEEGVGFHSTIEIMHKKGWRIELLSWRHSCRKKMREWSQEHGIFVALDDFYNNITFLTSPAAGRAVAEPRYATDIDLQRRKMLQ